MFRRLFRFVLYFAILFSASSCRKEADLKQRPNILLILADDMGYSDIGCFGGEVATPSLDSLAANGIRLTNFYNAARCCPTRASLLTGLYPHQAGMGGMTKKEQAKEPGSYQGYISDNSVTIAEVLKSAGYNTAASGKWHVGDFRPYWPTDRGFDNYFGLITGAANYFEPGKGRAKGKPALILLDSTAQQVTEDFYMTDAITDYAIRFLNKAENQKSPFFLYLAYTAPHWPLHAHQEDIKKYRGKYLKGWDILREERLDRMTQMGILQEHSRSINKDPLIPDWNSLSREEQERMDLLMSIYAAQIDRMDQGIGKVIEHLKRSGRYDNTLIIFLSDNGASAEYDMLGTDFWGNFNDPGVPPGSGDSYASYGQAWANLSNTPFREYKKYVHEGGIATPMIICWKNQLTEPGRISETPGHIIDVMQTCCDVSGVTYPQIFKDNIITKTVGHSLLPEIFNLESDDNRNFYWEHIGNRAIRSGDYKLVGKKNQEWELYNIKNDRQEQFNLVEEFPEMVDSLEQHYNNWCRIIGVE